MLFFDYPGSSSLSFPLGGIGTGSIGLASNGDIVDFEIKNRPARGTVNPYTFFSIKAVKDGKVLDSRAIRGDTPGDLMGCFGAVRKNGIYGLGIDRTTAAGLKHFENSAFSASFPFAKVKLTDKHFPGEVTLGAFSPFIPFDSDSASLPCAFFEIEIDNPKKDAEYTVALSSSAPLSGNIVKKYIQSEQFFGIISENEGDIKKSEKGEYMIAASGGDSSYQLDWYRGGWFDPMTMFIKDFSVPGKIENREYGTPLKKGEISAFTVASSKKAEDGKKITFRFFIGWYFPVAERYWTDDKVEYPVFSSRYSGAKEIIKTAAEEFDRLKTLSAKFAEIFSTQSLPDSFKEAILSNLSIMKSTSCVRLADGSLYGWEGVTEKSGNCEGTCTHVWNYAYSFPYLFPDIERSIHNDEFKYCIDKNGKMTFRNFIPYGGDYFFDFRACVDGQYGTVLKVYRDWKLSGDDDYLLTKLDKIISLIDYASSPQNPDRWDKDGNGILTGRQHHTLDMELFGPSSWLQGFYTSALYAASDICGYFGKNELAEKYRKMYENGKTFIDKELFNGEYYIQKIDLKNLDIVNEYDIGELIGGDGYKDETLGEIKYQIADGCEIDQVLADWHNDLIGLPEVFDKEKRKNALEALFRRNFKSMRELDNPCRVFAADDERGLIMCSFNPETSPKIPIPYAEECMTGFEYAAAVNMIQCDLFDEGKTVIEAVRERYINGKRNPFAEIECGASYARAMASYSILPAMSGFHADMTKKEVTFAPISCGEFFFSVFPVFGKAIITEENVELHPARGSLHLNSLIVKTPSGKETVFNDIYIEENKPFKASI